MAGPLPTSARPAEGGRFVPGARLAWVLLLPGVVLLLAPAAPAVVWAVAAVDALLCVIAVADAAAAARIPLTVARKLPRRLSVGAPNRVRLVVESREARPRVVRLRDDVPAAFEVDRPEVRLTVPAFGAATATLRVTPPSRGRFDWGDVHLRVRGPLGLAWADRVVPLAGEARVYPDVRSATGVVLAGGARDLARVGVHVLRREGEGSEFELLRDYVPGDAYRDVDWKATARRETPVVRVHAPERSQTVLLCVDASRLMAVRAGRLSRLDHAVNAALLVAFVALRHDDRVGLMVFDDAVQAYVPPGKGRAQYQRILEALFAVQPSRTYVDYRAFARAVLARQPRRALVLAFTDLHDEATSRPLVDNVRRLATRHLPVVLAMRDPELEATARRAPVDTEDPWRMAVAAELLDEREGLRRGLAQAGARILDPLPEEATLAAVNAYVEVKRRAAL